MLEIRYNKSTKELTGWWGNRHGNYKAKLKNRPDNVMAMLDIPIPDKPLGAWLYDEATQSLVPNPDYIEPKPPLVFEPPPGTGIPEKVEYIEQFLKELYRG